jgi:hypothetical protein
VVHRNVAENLAVAVLALADRKDGVLKVVGQGIVAAILPAVVRRRADRVLRETAAVTTAVAKSVARRLPNGDRDRATEIAKGPARREIVGPCQHAMRPSV